MPEKNNNNVINKDVKINNKNDDDINVIIHRNENDNNNFKSKINEKQFVDLR